MHLGNKQGPSVPEENMIKLAEIQLTKPGVDWIWEVGEKAALKPVLSLWGRGGSLSMAVVRVQYTQDRDPMESSNAWPKSALHGSMEVIIFSSVIVCMPVFSRLGSPG